LKDAAEIQAHAEHVLQLVQLLLGPGLVLSLFCLWLAASFGSGAFA
jgi:hypothetical protein